MGAGLGAAAILAAGSGMERAQAQLPPPANPVLTVKAAPLLTLGTEWGKVYQMQASADLQTWADTGEPVFGTGTPIEQPMAGPGQQFFRLKVLTKPAMGLAPWTGDGAALQFNEGARAVRCDFQAGGTGLWQTGNVTKTFQWTWQRNGFNTARADLVFADGWREKLDLNYSAPSAGQFSRTVTYGTRLKDTDAGSFGQVPAGGFTPVSTVPPVPTSITGRSIAFCQGSGGGSLTVGAANNGTRLLDGKSTAFFGNWLVTGSASARFTAHFNATHGEEYTFTFTGPLMGKFTRTTYTEGLLRDTDEGCFSLSPVP